MVHLPEGGQILENSERKYRGMVPCNQYIVFREELCDMYSQLLERLCYTSLDLRDVYDMGGAKAHLA